MVHVWLRRETHVILSLPTPGKGLASKGLEHQVCLVCLLRLLLIALDFFCFNSVVALDNDRPP
jgi:hypothetical protein